MVGKCMVAVVLIFVSFEPRVEQIIDPQFIAHYHHYSFPGVSLDLLTFIGSNLHSLPLPPHRQPLQYTHVNRKNTCLCMSVYFIYINSIVL